MRICFFDSTYYTRVAAMVSINKSTDHKYRPSAKSNAPKEDRREIENSNPESSFQKIFREHMTKNF